MAKNLVGSAWDRSSSNSFGKTFAEKREWNGIDDAEKEALKGGLLCLLFAEKDSRVREQLVVLVIEGADLPKSFLDPLRATYDKKLISNTLQYT